MRFYFHRMPTFGGWNSTILSMPSLLSVVVTWMVMIILFVHEIQQCSGFVAVPSASTPISIISSSRQTRTTSTSTTTTSTSIFFCPPIRHLDQRPLSTTTRRPTPTSTIITESTGNFRYNPYHNIADFLHPCLQNQRRSMFHARIQRMGLFGLGTAEIVIIAVVGVVLLGPDQVSSQLGKLVGQLRGELDDIPDELKKIPQEFQKGVEEGEMNARARNAKQMSNVDDNNKSSPGDEGGIDNNGSDATKE